VKQQVMQFLVSAKWIEGEAKDRGVSATDAELQRQFKQTKDQSFPNEKAYKRFLKTSGQNEQDLLFRVRLELLSNKIRQQVTEQGQNVSDSEIEDYYNKNEQQFSQPERRDLEVILTKNQSKALAAKKAIEGGQKWSAAAKKYSVDPASKEQGGKLLGVSKGQQDPQFDAAIFAAVQGKIAGPVKTNAGYYVFRVTKVTKATKQALEQSKQGIKQLLVSQKQQKALDQFSTTFRNRWRKRTDCADEYVIADCRNGREPTQATPPAVPPGQPQPVPGSSGANPPALDGTGSNLAGGNGEGTVIGNNPQAAAGGAAGLGGLPGGAGGPNAPLALGGAPKKGAAAAGGLPGSVPGATPGAAGQQQVPPQGQQQAPQGGG
jgi:foldase protein PrsA